MGRRKGDSYRKWKTKEIVRVCCPSWTIPIDLIAEVKDTAKKLKKHESRIVEVAIKQFLTNPPQKLHNPEKIFTEN